MGWVTVFVDKVLHKIRYRLYKAIKSVENEQNNLSLNRLKKRIPVCGEALHINGKITLTEPRMVSMGSNVHIGDNAYFNTAGGLVIGDNVHFSRNVTIYTSSHNYHGAVPYDEKLIVKPVVICRNAWIGMNVCITPG